MIHEAIMEHFIDVIAEIESGGDPNAIGDKHLKNKAYGILQIRKPCLDDYNRWNKTAWKVEDLLGNEELPRKVFKDYMKYYATKKRLGREPTLIDMARIWNGGPNGWRKSSTRGYGAKVERLIKERNIA